MVSTSTTIYPALSNGKAPTQDCSNASVLELVLMRVRLLAQRRAAWLAQLWGDRSKDTNHSGNGYLQACLDDRDTPEAEAVWYQHTEQIQPLNQILQQIEQALAGDAGSRLHQLGQKFQLSAMELELLQACLALAIDPNLGSVYAHLQLHSARTYATATLAARLFGYGYQSLWQSVSSLAVWQLVQATEVAPGEPQPLVIDPVVVDWLQGDLRLDDVLMGRVHPVPQLSPLEHWPVMETARALERVLQQESAVRVQIVGPPASGRRTFAAAVAQQFGLETLSINTSEIADADWPDLFVRVQRLAVMGNMAVVWYGQGLHHIWPDYIAPAPLQFVACAPEQSVPASERAINYRIELPTPSLEERRQLWQAAIPEAVAWPTPGLDTLVTRYCLNPGDIAVVGRRGPTSAQEAIAFARECTRQHLGELGRLLDCPFTWEDLVLPDRVRQNLEDFAFEAQERSRFWELASARRLFPRGTGLVGLFGGPPGTGKTMAAQVIAADLELDLFRIDLATVVSKYIGETAKHLKQIFARAARMNAVLLFDEADALFSKRTEVKDSHDRYANADTSYLLQLLEEYRGIAILATNKKQNVDAAFTRRIRYIIDFPRPDAAQRQRIWQQTIGELCGEETGQRLVPAIAALAEGIEISGAQIKNAVLASIFIARRSREPLAMPHLLRGVERELSKEGRTLGSRERGRLIQHG